MAFCLYAARLLLLDLQFQFLDFPLVSFAETIVFVLCLPQPQLEVEFLDLHLTWRDRTFLLGFELLQQLDREILRFLSLKGLYVVFSPVHFDTSYLLGNVRIFTFLIATRAP